MSDFHPGTWNPAWSVATILTGLLSFMLSEEMTTGSITTTDAHKRAFAARSHAWNLTQQRFKEAFPEHCTPVARAFPNMGQREQGKPAAPAEPAVATSLPSGSTAAATGLRRPGLGIAQATGLASSSQQSGSVSFRRNATVPTAPHRIGKPEEILAPAAGTWGKLVWEKWPLGLLIALALMISRISSSN